MVRAFTDDVGRYKRGDIRDYPIQTWKGLERSARRPLGAFSKLVEDVVKESTTRDNKGRR